jgi:TRAP-type C4-dicarboxylate transport system permease small subunit
MPLAVNGGIEPKAVERTISANIAVLVQIIILISLAVSGGHIVTSSYSASYPSADFEVPDVLRDASVPYGCSLAALVLACRLVMRVALER